MENYFNKNLDRVRRNYFAGIRQHKVESRVKHFQNVYFNENVYMNELILNSKKKYEILITYFDKLQDLPKAISN